METRMNASRLAAIHYEKGSDIDALLVDICRRLAGEGLRLGGLLQISSGGIGGCATSVHLVDLRTRSSFDIWEERGACARGCRLDETGLLEAAHVFDAAIKDRVDMIVFNRFGRAESLGRGLMPYFANAVEADIAVLTSVREPYVEAWRQFHGGLALELETHVASVVSWAVAAARSHMGSSPEEQLA